MTDEVRSDEPMYVISVAARLVNMHPQTLRYYERAGLLTPTRSRGRIRLYSQHDIDRLRQIVRLTDEMGVNLAGVEIILRLLERLAVIQHELERQKIRLESDYTISLDLPPAERTAKPEHAGAARAVKVTTVRVRRARR